MSDAAAPDPVAAALAALRIAAVDGVASVRADDYAPVVLGDSASRVEDTALRRLLVHVLGAATGRGTADRALKSARDRLEQRIQAARDQARAQRIEREERHEQEVQARAAAIQARLDSGDRLGALELRLGEGMPVLRRVAGVSQDAPLSAAVAAFAAARGLNDDLDAALLLVAEATAVPGAVSNPHVEAARELLGLTSIERDDDPASLSPQQARYEMRPEGIVYLREVEGGSVPMLVATFTARILREIVRDDGSGSTVVVFEIEVKLGGRTVTVQVPAAKFVLMLWPLELVGAEARVVAGAPAKDRARDAIQKASGQPPRSIVYLHTGWRLIERTHVYLHGGGAMGPDGPQAGIVVELPPVLAPLDLPIPPEGEALRAAVRASLALVGLAGDGVTCVSLGLLYRSVLPGLENDVSLFLTGRTGYLKTTFLVLLLKHLGAAFAAGNLANWSWTANALEAYAFAAKDVLTPVDEASPDGSAADRQRQWGTVQRLFRAQGNQSGRGRAAPDGTLRSPRSPRGLLAATGEDVPPGESALARAVIVDLPPRDTPGGVKMAGLDAAQAHGDAGTYAQAMSAFIRSLAQEYAEVTVRAKAAYKRWRSSLSAGARHPRTPANLAHAAVGWEEWLRFAVACGAITPDQSAGLLGRVEAALRAAVRVQDHQQANADPVVRFHALLRSAVSSGGAHVATMAGLDPTDGKGGLGWRREDRQVRDEVLTVMKEHGRRVAWLDGNDLYVDLDAGIRAADEVAGPFGDGVPLKPKTLAKRLKEAGLLASTESDERHTVRRRIEGAERRIYHLRADFLLGKSGALPPEPANLPNAPKGCAECGAATPENGVGYHGCAACRAVLNRGGAA